MKLTLGYSPCPNDTFIFHAIANKKIDLLGIEFNVILADVEELNTMAFQSKLDITKLSFYTYFLLLEKYQLLPYGSALGKGCGPLLISKNILQKNSIAHYTVAVPGENTTANFLLSFAFPEVHAKKYILFSEIEDRILKEDFDAGVIIHENRFTYKQKGLHKIEDLGEVWETQTSLPIPLGGIALKRNIDDETKNKISIILKNSIKYAYHNMEETLTYCKDHAQEMSTEVMLKHIHLYVNNFTKELGDEGNNAIQFMAEKVLNTNNIPLPLIFNHS